jgi:DNA-binding transcriptional MerR regulator
MEAIEQFTIQQASDQTGLTEHTLRYYEKIGLIEGIDRANNGHRRYTTNDVGWIEFLKCLRATGMPISQMKEYSDLTRLGSHTLEDRIELLEERRDEVIRQIAELNQYLEVLQHKINYYENEKTLLEEAEMR